MTGVQTCALPISEIDWKKTEKVEDVLKEGQEIEVKLIEIDAKTGKLKLSRKALLPRPERSDRPEGNDRPERSDRPDRENREKRD